MRTDKKGYHLLCGLAEQRRGGQPLGDNLVGVVCGTFWQRFKSLAVISRARHKAKSQREREKKNSVKYQKKKNKKENIEYNENAKSDDELKVFGVFSCSSALLLQLAQLPKPFSLICNTLQMMRGKMMTVCQDDDDHYDDCQADDDVPSWLSRKQNLSGPRRCGAIVTQTLCMHNQSREKGKKDGKSPLFSPSLSCSLLSGSPSAARLAPVLRAPSGPS